MFFVTWVFLPVMILFSAFSAYTTHSSVARAGFTCSILGLMILIDTGRRMMRNGFRIVNAFKKDDDDDGGNGAPQLASWVQRLRRSSPIPMGLGA